MAPKGKELSDDLKDTIVQLHKSGLGYKKISNRLQISANTIAKIVQKFKCTGDVRAKPRLGRPSLLTKRDERHIRQCVIKDRNRAASSIAQEISSVSGKSVSAQTIRRSLNAMEFHGRIPRKKPLLNAKHKANRLSFAKTYKNKENNFWSKVLWSDETKINLFGSDGIKRVWRRAGEAYNENCTKPTVKHGGGSVMVWGCMSTAGVGQLQFIEGKMDSKMYCEILKNKMLPSLRTLGRGAKFQHDNDPKHTAKITSQFFSSKKVSVLPWPSMSPDLNPIEHLWGVLKRKVEEKKPRNTQQLKQAVEDEWMSIQQATCANLVESMPRRLDAVISNKGSHTKY